MSQVTEYTAEFERASAEYLKSPAVYTETTLGLIQKAIDASINIDEVRLPPHFVFSELDQRSHRPA